MLPGRGHHNAPFPGPCDGSFPSQIWLHHLARHARQFRWSRGTSHNDLLVARPHCERQCLKTKLTMSLHSVLRYSWRRYCSFCGQAGDQRITAEREASVAPSASAVCLRLHRRQRQCDRSFNTRVAAMRAISGKRAAGSTVLKGSRESRGNLMLVEDACRSPSFVSRREPIERLAVLAEDPRWIAGINRWLRVSRASSVPLGPARFRRDARYRLRPDSLAQTAGG